MAQERMVRVSSKGQIVLPKRIRDKMGIGEGDYLAIEDLGNGLLVVGKPSRLFEVIAEPITREAEAIGFTREQLMEMIKAMRAERKADAA